MADLPLIMTADGPVPTPPDTIRDTIIALATADAPGLTANLPGALIEDIVSTDVGACVVMDSARVDLVNSIAPTGANLFLLNQLAGIYGVLPGVDTNTSVFVVFTGPPGFLVSAGFTVSDGTHQYVVQDGGVVASSGVTQQLFAVATIAGTWAVPQNTVTQLITSVPTDVSLTVTNPQTGTPSGGAQSTEDFRQQVLQAGLASAQGMSRFLKTLLGNVPGVQSRLVSVRQSGGGWEIIVGGGDPYLVAGAIYSALFDINTLVPSVIGVTGITNAALGVVTTNLNHGLVTDQSNVQIAGVVGMSGVNGGPYTVSVLSPTTFTFGVDTTGSGGYTSGGVVTPNTRNIVATINDYPDAYNIPFVNPPQETVTLAVTWNTTATNLVSDAAVTQLAAPALVSYINSIPTGAPINLYELQATFQSAVVSLIPTQLLTRMVFSVNIDGIGVSPSSGTGIIAGDPESYFQTDTTKITISQG